MKKTVFAQYRFAPLLLLLSGMATAQTNELPSKKSPKTGNGEVSVQIIERNGNEVRETNRTYHMDGMSDPQRDKIVMKLVDSLKAARKDGVGKRQMTIIVEDNDGDKTVTVEKTRPNTLRRLPNDAYARRGRIQPNGNGNDSWNSQNWQYEFRRGADSLADKLNRFQFQIPKDWDRQLARPFEDWSRNMSGKPSTIRGLDAFPNNPDHDQLNVRFTAPAKGDISIVVTNTKGKEVSRRDIKDFSGEYVGQVDLGKKPQGTYFITVTQNEDGAVKRVVVE